MGLTAIFDYASQVFYATNDSSRVLSLKYYHQTNGWQTVAIDPNSNWSGCNATGATEEISAVTNGNNGEDIYWISGTGSKLRHAWHEGSLPGIYHCETLDGSGGIASGAVGHAMAHPVGLIWNGGSHVFYTDLELALPNGVLRHAYWNGAMWVAETLNAAAGGGALSGEGGRRIAAMLKSDGNPIVFYFSGDTSRDLVSTEYISGYGWYTLVRDGNGCPPRASNCGHITNDVGREITTASLGNDRFVFYRAYAGPNDPSGCPDNQPFIRVLRLGSSYGTISQCSAQGLSAVSYEGAWHLFFHKLGVLHGIQGTGTVGGGLITIDSGNWSPNANNTAVALDINGSVDLYYMLSNVPGPNDIFKHAWY